MNDEQRKERAVEKTKQITIRLSEEDYKLLKIGCKFWSEKSNTENIPSQFIRSLIRTHYYLQMTEEDHKEFG